MKTQSPALVISSTHLKWTSHKPVQLSPTLLFFHNSLRHVSAEDVTAVLTSRLRPAFISAMTYSLSLITRLIARDSSPSCQYTCRAVLRQLKNICSWPTIQPNSWRNLHQTGKNHKQLCTHAKDVAIYLSTNISLRVPMRFSTMFKKRPRFSLATSVSLSTLSPLSLWTWDTISHSPSVHTLWEWFDSFPVERVKKVN